MAVNIATTVHCQHAAHSQLNKTQMVLSHDNRIIISNGQQPHVTSSRQLTVNFIATILL